ncbi:hypothetical protein EYF80_066621 [Liparis tanakae]|uniref:Uncharacterized protein n=1 Tax=Liparis tanakae TaxID=230148 RepID=A0A4Z2E3G8_9TELE|nr:hypothetical protein EYF80_066621 [Liparis tanakae]
MESASSSASDRLTLLKTSRSSSSSSRSNMCPEKSAGTVAPLISRSGRGSRAQLSASDETGRRN